MDRLVKVSSSMLVMAVVMSGCTPKPQPQQKPQPTVKKSYKPSSYEHKTTYNKDGMIESEHIKRKHKNTVETYDFETMFENKSLIATGVFIHKNETIALNMATNMAINNLAKTIGRVVQKEDSTLYNEKVHMIIETHHETIVQGFTILSQTYDTTTGRAEVTIKKDSKTVAGTLEKYVKGRR